MMHPITAAQIEGQGLTLPLDKIDTGTSASLASTYTQPAQAATKRGINLGCGRIILPCERPDHHGLIPSELYEAGAYEWDNVDSVANEGVNKVIDLFDYPWREVRIIPNYFDGHRTSAHIPDNTYDVAIATHLCEHIPHAIKRNGEIVDTHGGWWAWWNELGRVLKPGAVAHILVPYGPSRGGFIDPTHTRYLLPETFGYFENNPDAPFDYPLEYEWDALALPIMGYTQLAWDAAEQEFGEATTETLWKIANKYFGAVSEFSISLRVKK